MFRASSLSALDPAWIDSEVEKVMSALTGRNWQRIGLVYLASPIIESSVVIGGLTSDVLRVRMGKSDLERLAHELQWDTIGGQEIIDEVANTIAGHVKVGLADGLVTGIPQRTADSPEPGAYRATFSWSQLLMEVSSSG